MRRCIGGQRWEMRASKPRRRWPLFLSHRQLAHLPHEAAALPAAPPRPVLQLRDLPETWQREMPNRERLLREEAA